MVNIRNVFIRARMCTNDGKIWEIISYFFNSVEKFDIVCYNKADIMDISKELISSKKKIKTCNDKEEAIRYLNNINQNNAKIEIFE